MVASTMKNRLSRYGVEVAHTAVDQIPSDTSLILIQEGLVDRVRKRAPSVRIVPFTNYMNDPAFDRVETEVRAARGDAATAPTSKEEAITMAGQVLIDEGAADDVYVKGMLAREKQISTYMGEGVAIPHGVDEVRDHIDKVTLGFLQFPEGVEWDGNICTVVIPIASSSDEHLEIMAALARILSNPETARQLREATCTDEVLNLLGSQQA